MVDSNQAAAGIDRAAAIERIFDSIVASRVRSIVAILIVTLVAFLPGFQTIAPLDREEPRYALGTKLMIETGDYTDIGQSGDLRFFQPLAINWLQSVSITLFGEGARSAIWVYRLPSLAGAIAVAFLTWWTALAFGRPRAAFLAAALIATTPLLVAEAHLAKTDAVLLAAIVLAEGALARLWQKKTTGPDYGLAFVFWTALGLGVLVKGLMAPFVVGLTIAVLSASMGSASWLRRLAPGPGAIWLVVIVVLSNLAFGFGAGGSAVDVLLPEGIATQQVYAAPPGTYAILFYPLFGPAGVFVALAIPGVLDRIRRPAVLFSIAWAVPFWIVMELWPVKLPYYILPAYPALAILGATAIDARWLRVSGWLSTYFSLNLVAWPLIVGVGGTILYLATENRLPFLALPFFVSAIVAGTFAFHWFYRGYSTIASAVLSMASALLLYAGLFGVVVAQLSAIQISGRLVAAGKNAVSCDKPLFASTGFAEPSLVFYTGSDILLTSPGEAANFLAAGGCRVAFVEARRQSIFNQRAEDLGLELNVRSEIRGGNFGNWKTLRIRVFAVEDGPDGSSP